MPIPYQLPESLRPLHARAMLRRAGHLAAAARGASRQLPRLWWGQHLRTIDLARLLGLFKRDVELDHLTASPIVGPGGLWMIEVDERLRLWCAINGIAVVFYWQGELFGA